jgi:hypothetical protein
VYKAAALERRVQACATVKASAAACMAAPNITTPLFATTPLLQSCALYEPGEKLE